MQVQGKLKRVKKFIRWAQKGPDGAKVSEVKVKWKKRLKPVGYWVTFTHYRQPDQSDRDPIHPKLSTPDP